MVCGFILARFVPRLINSPPLLYGKGGFIFMVCACVNRGNKMANINYEVVGQRLVLSAVLDKEDTYKVIKNKSFFSVNIYKKPEWTTGVTSMTEDGKHILMLDYDDVLKSVMLQDLTNLRQEGVSAPFYIFTTKERKWQGDTIGNYHVICPQKFVAAEVVRLQGFTNCDYAYKTMPTRNPYRSWVLRIAAKGVRPKPKFLELKKYNYGVRVSEPPQVEVSRAHVSLVHKLYPNIPSISYDHLDNSTKLYLNQYETLNRVS
jgi:hypothetical protein